MIEVSYENNKLVLRCSSSISGEVLYAVSNIKHSQVIDKDKIFLEIDIEHINEINKILVPFKKNLVITESFKLWRASKKVNPVIIEVGPTYSKIFRSIDFDIPDKQIDDKCKYFFKPAINQSSYKNKRWDGYIHLYKKGIRKFLTGLLSDVTDILDKNSIPYKINYVYDTSPKREFNWSAKNLFQLSEDQEECIESAIKAKRCVVKAATGFGKLLFL